MSVWSVLSAVSVFVAGLSAGRVSVVAEAGRLFVLGAVRLRHLVFQLGGGVMIVLLRPPGMSLSV